MSLGSIRSASLYWLGYRRIPLGASLKFAYGSASSDLDRLYRESVTLDPALGVAVPAGGGDAGVEDRFQESDRFAVVLGNHDGAGNGLRWQALWDYVRFDFMDPAPDARANIHRIDGTLEYKTKQWSAAINVLYTDQDYG
ncbi:MAG: hypothetical protein IH969_09865, partial [Candidatus Krumholzibacteriota bacterium]|nr:hypothetical protein [Candidatus Krumholzibacteriota bacterium]